MKPIEMKICLESSHAFGHWLDWCQRKGLRVKVEWGWLWRIFDHVEWDRYLRA
jgi:hypothetical protein